jgi:hypothetical protein
MEAYRIISAESLKKAFINGIDSFIGLYNLQANKSYVSSTLGNLAMNIKSQGVHTYEITTLEIEKANRIKAIIDRESDNELIDFFNSFGKKLEEIAEQKCKRSFIASHYSFIVLSVFHTALTPERRKYSVKQPSEVTYHKRYIEERKEQKGFEHSNNYMKELLYSYLTPDTRKKNLITPLFYVVSDCLKKVDINTFKERHHLDGISSLSQLSEQDKLLCLLCDNRSPLKTLVKDFFDVETFEKYSTLSKDILRGNKYNNQELDDSNLHQDTVELVKKAFSSSERMLKNIENIIKALSAYILKFDQNTQNPAISRQISSNVSFYSQNYAIGMEKTNVESIVTLNALQTAFPPGVIADLVANISIKLIQLGTKSKGYGIINRHGITGQTRALLLKNYLNMISIYIKNSYFNIFNHMNQENIKACCNYITFLENTFTTAYKESIEVLPNKDNQGSLYYYLQMYANTSNDFKQDKKRISQWNKSKLSYL